MRTRIAVVALAVGLAAAVSGTAASAPNGLRNCGTKTVAGKSWQTIANNVPCATAWSIVRRLTPTNVPRTGRYPGLRSRMTCIGVPPGHKATRIACAAAGKSVRATIKA